MCVCTHVYICLSICLSACLSICLFTWLSIYLSDCQSNWLYLYVYLPVLLLICLFVLLSVSLSVCLSICLYVCMSIRLSEYILEMLEGASFLFMLARHVCRLSSFIFCVLSSFMHFNFWYTCIEKAMLDRLVSIFGTSCHQTIDRHDLISSCFISLTNSISCEMLKAFVYTIKMAIDRSVTRMYDVMWELCIEISSDPPVPQH